MAEKAKTKEILEAFALKHKVVLVEKGECGFGRPCVGFTFGDNYIDYNPLTDDFQRIGELEDDRHYRLAPEDAYHKHDCMAVLVYDGDYDKGLRQLADWATNLEEIGVEVVSYPTGHTGIQAMFSGVVGRALKLKPRSSPTPKESP